MEKGPRCPEERGLVLCVCSAATGGVVVGFERGQRGCAGLTGEWGEKGSRVGGEWAVSVAVRGAVPEPLADMILCRPSPACSSSCHSALRDAPCSLVRKARRRRASAALGRLSQPSASSFQRPATRPHTHQHSWELERHHIPLSIPRIHAGGQRLFAPSCRSPSSHQLPTAPTSLWQNREPVAQQPGICFHCCCLQVRCEGGGRGVRLLISYETLIAS